MEKGRENELHDTEGKDYFDHDRKLKEKDCDLKNKEDFVKKDDKGKTKSLIRR